MSKSPSSPWRRVLVGAVVIIALVIVAYFGISAFVADRLSRPERHALTRTPAEYGLPFENVHFDSTVDNIPLSGWYIDSPGERVIVLAHGWNGVRDDGVNLDVANELARRNYDVLMFDFRGHGESGGEHLGMGTLETRDVAGALNYLKTRGVNEEGGIGFSMGAVTLLNAAPELPKLRALVVDSPFADAKPLLEERVPQASGLPSFFLPGMFMMYQIMYGTDIRRSAPVNSIAQLKDRPLLFIYGTEDELVPQSQLEQNARAGLGNPQFESWRVEGAKHTQAYRSLPEEYARRIGDFFDRYLK
jgi:uncharacterized protein